MQAELDFADPFFLGDEAKAGKGGCSHRIRRRMRRID